jgi:hypothetical protein
LSYLESQDVRSDLKCGHANVRIVLEVHWFSNNTGDIVFKVVRRLLTGDCDKQEMDAGMSTVVVDFSSFSESSENPSAQVKLGSQGFDPTQP